MAARRFFAGAGAAAGTLDTGAAAAVATAGLAGADFSLDEATLRRSALARAARVADLDSRAGFSVPDFVAGAGCDDATTAAGASVGAAAGAGAGVGAATAGAVAGTGLSGFLVSASTSSASLRRFAGWCLSAAMDLATSPASTRTRARSDSFRTSGDLSSRAALARASRATGEATFPSERTTSARTVGSGSFASAAARAPAPRLPAQSATRRALAARRSAEAGGCSSNKAAASALSEQSWKASAARNTTGASLSLRCHTLTRTPPKCQATDWDR